jgi:phosphatidate cytidylyltransferase
VVAITVGLVLGGLGLLAFSVGNLATLVIATAVVFLASVEAFTGFRKAGYRPAVLLGWVAVVLLMVFTYNKGQIALPLVIVLLVALTMLWYAAGVERGADPLLGGGATLFVFCWIGVFGSYAALLLNPNLFPDRHGIAFLVGAILVTVVYDIAALGVGSWIGSRQLAPSISPGKTWEGAIGGGVAAVLAAVLIVHLIHPWTPGSAAVLGVVVAIVAPLGDLFESVVKRTLGVKDMGRLLPGHGGFLDRIDGLLFVVPATYYLVKAFNLG